VDLQVLTKWGGTSSMDSAELWDRIAGERERLIGFAQRLVQTPSMSGQEGDVAALLQAEMESLGYDEVGQDAAGNMIGRIAGGSGPALMLNGHMDHVDAGNPDDWPHPPYDGKVHDGELWGRGATDMKGALAAMVYAGGLTRKLGVTPPGDVYVSGVVQEEVGGLGARHLARTLPVPRVVVGEASGNQLRRGHRGRVELMVLLSGRSVHAAMPELGTNPHFSMARFLTGLRNSTMAVDPVYGASTVAPTRVASKPQSANVTPSELSLVLDWRHVPGEEVDEIVSALEALVAGSLEGGCEGKVQVVMKELTSYTGLQMGYPDVFPSFTTPSDEPWLIESRSVLAAAWKRDVEVDIWRFATDGGHFAAAGANVLGFGPGDDGVVHTVRERVPVEELLEAAVGYAALALADLE
jgi:putative selenium metabolism hydrolase